MTPRQPIRSERVVIIGGGASLREFDFKRVASSFCLSINEAWRLFLPGAVYVRDRRYLAALADELGGTIVGSVLRIFVPESVTHPTPEMFARLPRLEAVPEAVIPNVPDAGLGAIMLARHWGAREIFLLGYDLKSKGDTVRNWHDRYPPGWRVNSCVLAERYLPKYRKYAAENLVAGIVNLSPDSALDCFEKRNVDEVFPCLT